MTLDDSIKNKKVLITCGTGGVGKTTLSAALGVRSAWLGKKTVVVTMDPAKRLATALGLKNLGDHPTDLTPLLIEAAKKIPGARAPLGTLAAIMPDTRRTFETFVRELAPTPVIADRVMRNPIFQLFTKEFSGANEYMALERLDAIVRTGDYDLIVLDTPPSRNTLAFLDAPQLLARFFEERLIRWLVLPANKLLATGMRKALGILESLTGAGFMTHLFDFTAALFEVRTGFTANLKRITELLKSKDVGFLMVTTPTPETVEEIRHFVDTLHDHQFRFEGVALNRTLGYLEVEEKERSQPYLVLRGLQKRERHVLEELSRTGIPLCAKLPEMARDVHSLEDLFHVAMAFETGSLDQHDLRPNGARSSKPT